MTKLNERAPIVFADFEASSLIKACQALLAEHTATAAAATNQHQNGNDIDSQGKDNKPAPSPMAVPIDKITSLEALLICMAGDETEWSAAWVKMLDYILKGKNFALPPNLKALNLDVPKQWRYILDGDLTGVKAESKSPAKANGSSLCGGAKRPHEDGFEDDDKSVLARNLVWIRYCTFTIIHYTT